MTPKATFEPVTAEVWAKQLLRQMHFQPYEGEKPYWYGQESLITQITPFMESDRPFPHIILLGEPGLGKSHLARYIAYKRNETFEEILAPVDPITMPTRGIVLLDEVHRQRSPELLFEGMKQEAPTIFAATARPDLVDRAFRSRFFLELHMKPYTAESMTALIGNRIRASKETLELLGTAAGGNPRQAEKIAEVAIRLDTDDPAEILAICQITADGLTIDHIEYLKLLNKLKKPVGVSQIVTLSYSDEQTIKTTERVLLEFDLIQLSQNGRKITRAGIDYIKAFDGS